MTWKNLEKPGLGPFWESGDPDLQERIRAYTRCRENTTALRAPFFCTRVVPLVIVSEFQLLTLKMSSNLSDLIWTALYVLFFFPNLSTGFTIYLHRPLRNFSK